MKVAGFDAVLKSLNKLDPWLRSLGIEPKSDRWHQAIQIVDRAKEQRAKVERGGPREHIGNYMDGLFEAMEIHEIVEAFGGESSAAFKAKLERALCGPISPFDEQPKNSEARNTMFELSLAADWKNAGNQVEVGEPDIKLRASAALFQTECKRPFSENSVRRNIEDAASQLGKELNKPGNENDCGIIAISLSRVTGVDPEENRVTIERENRSAQTYDPRRLSGVSVHREAERDFSNGDRVQFAAPSKDIQVANRDLGTVEQVNSRGDLKIRMDSGREIRFNIREHPHIDYGYAVTSHSSQGQTAQRVLIHVDTDKSELLVNNRFAYVSVSRAQHDAHIYTNDGGKLSRSLSRESSQRTATEVEQQPTLPKTEPSLSVRGTRPSEEEQGRSLGIGLV